MFKYCETDSLIHKIQVIYKCLLLFLIVIVVFISKSNYLYIMLIILNLILYLISNLPININKIIINVLFVLILCLLSNNIGFILFMVKLIYILSIINLFFRTTKLTDFSNFKIVLFNSLFIYIFIPFILIYKYTYYIISNIICISKSRMLFSEENKRLYLKKCFFEAIGITNNKYNNFKRNLLCLLSNNNIKYKNVFLILSVILIFILIVYKEVIL